MKNIPRHQVKASVLPSRSNCLCISTKYSNCRWTGNTLSSWSQPQLDPPGAWYRKIVDFIPFHNSIAPTTVGPDRLTSITVYRLRDPHSQRSVGPSAVFHTPLYSVPTNLGPDRGIVVYTVSKLPYIVITVELTLPLLNSIPRLHIKDRNSLRAIRPVYNIRFNIQQHRKSNIHNQILNLFLVKR